jgi:hypothetical protein
MKSSILYYPRMSRIALKSLDDRYLREVVAAIVVR